MTISFSWLPSGRAPGAKIKSIAPRRRFVEIFITVLILMLTLLTTPVFGRDLDEVQKSGKLRHLGIPYANFISLQGDGLDMELMQLFATHIGVTYEFVPSTWGTIIADLTGKYVRPRGDDVVITGKTPVKGDVIAAGFTKLKWRQKVLAFASATFPTGVWLIARANSVMSPITPSGDVVKDIDLVKAGLKGQTVLALKDSCLDPQLYHLETAGAIIRLLAPERNLDEMIPLVIAGSADTTLMDVPVALIALEKWPGKIKVVGPVSQQQEMAPAFNKSSPRLREAFETFFERCKKDGTYFRLVRKYYPTVFSYYPDFFTQ